MMDSEILPDDHDICIERLVGRVQSALPVSGRTGVVHLGAHKGEEVATYLQSGYQEIVLCEANPDLVDGLKKTFKGQSSVQVIHAAVADTIGSLDFIVHRTASGSVESASLLELKRLGEIVPVFDSNEVVNVPALTLDSIAQQYDLFNKVRLVTIDIQGAEKMALSGGSSFLPTVEAVICEVNVIENYQGCALEPELDEIFDSLGFDKEYAIYHELYTEHERFVAWGECVWVNRNIGAVS